MLTMMSVLYKNQDLPEKRWQLYERCADVLLLHWELRRKGLDQLRELLPNIHVAVEHKAEILQRVSMFMLEHGQEGRELNAISYEPLMSILAQYMQVRFAQPRGDAESIAKTILEHLRERTYILAETANIPVTSPSKGTVKFKCTGFGIFAVYSDSFKACRKAQNPVGRRI